jgi:hypothetical protein
LYFEGISLNGRKPQAKPSHVLPLEYPFLKTCGGIYIYRELSSITLLQIVDKSVLCIINESIIQNDGQYTTRKGLCSSIGYKRWNRKQEIIH